MFEDIIEGQKKVMPQIEIHTISPPISPMQRNHENLHHFFEFHNSSIHQNQTATSEKVTKINDHHVI